MPKITPFLWFDGRAEEAIEFYLSVFPDSKRGAVLRCGDAGPGPKGSLLTGSFTINGCEFTALNGGPNYQMTPGTSFVIHCRTQDEVDHYWDRLSAGGQTMACGWLTDRFGVTWQVTPDMLVPMLMDEDPVRAGRVMQVMMTMVKLEIAPLQRAYDGA